MTDLLLEPTTPVLAAPGGLIVVYAQGPLDLESALTVQILDADGTVVATAAPGAIQSDTEMPDIDGALYVARVPGPLVSGTYTVRWTGPDPDQVATEPLTVTVLPGWAPSLEDVAALCPAYTRRPITTGLPAGGREAGFFDGETNPTDAQVMGFIGAAVGEVAGRCGVSAATLALLPDLARRAAAWHAAASIEAEKAPHVAEETTGAYAWKQASYVACLNELITQARSGALRLG